MSFNGYTGMTMEEYLEKKDTTECPLLQRPLTWCDLFYMAAVEVTEDKAVLITRYPMDQYFNQFPTKVRVSSTRKTVKMVVDGKYYPFYPDIPVDKIGTNTTNVFTDTLKISNAYLTSIVGDYDGDQVSCKSVYSMEANQELLDQINSKRHYVALDMANIMSSTNEGKQALFNLTMVLPEDASKMDKVVF